MVSKNVTPDTPDDLRDFLDDKDKRSKAFETPETAQEFIEKYRAAANARDPDIDGQMNDQQKAALQEFLEANGYKRAEQRSGRVPADGDAVSGHKGAKAIYDHLGMDRKALTQIAASGHGAGVGHAEQFDDAGDFAIAVIKKLWQRGEPDARLKDLSEAVAGDGGVLVPEEFRAELLMIALETSVVRPRARVIPMGSASLRYPAIRDTTHATNVFGGVSGTWIAEAGSLSSATNQPRFSSVRLVANKLTGYSVVSQELIADSAIAMEGIIQSLYPEAIAYFEDDAFINGTGAGQPLGIINADGLISVAKESGQAATTIVWENILNMYSRMLPTSMGRAVWIAHADTFPQLATMALQVGTGGNGVWLANGVAGPPVTILGRPVIFTEKCQTVGTAGDIFFVDLAQYLIGDRQAMTMALSEHVNFTTDELTYRFTERVDGRPWVTSALTPRNGSTTVSPYLNLATRA